MTPTNKSLLFFILFLIAGSSYGSEKLSVTIEGVKNNRGVVQLAMWESSQGFPENYRTAVKLVTLELDNLKNVLIDNVESDDYAIAVYHDENEDVVLNRNFLGIPREGFGFSQNPVIRFSAPSFQDCRFVLRESEEKNLTIKINYP